MLKTCSMCGTVSPDRSALLFSKLDGADHGTGTNGTRYNRGAMAMQLGAVSCSLSETIVSFARICSRMAMPSAPIGTHRHQ